MSPGRRLVLSLALLLSGASGLTLQVAWSDRLSVVLGAGDVAIAAVVAATMGGLALGAVLGGALAERCRASAGRAWAGSASAGHASAGHASAGHACAGHASAGHACAGRACAGRASAGRASAGRASAGRACAGRASAGRAEVGYAGAELLVAAGALLVPVLANLVGSAEAALVASGWPATSSAWTLFEALGAAVLLLLPTTAMGAALPLLAPALGDDPQRRGLGAFYAINTLGAAFGALVATFWLLPNLGLGLTERVAAGGHALAGILVWACAWSRSTHRAAPPEASSAVQSRRHLARRNSSSPRGAGAASARAVVVPRGAAAPTFLLAALVLGSMASFTLEMLWSRLFAFLLGSSLAGFGIMLALFILGLALGAGAATSSKLVKRPLATFAAAQGLAALAGCLAFWTLAIVTLRLSPSAMAPTPRLLLAAALLLPLTVLLGAGVPLAFRIAADRGATGALASGQILAASTAGAVVGVVLGTFVLLPLGGFAGTVRAAALLGVAAAVAAGSANRGRRRLLAGLALAAIALVWLWPLRRPDGLLRRIGFGEFASERGTLVSAEAGPSATVVVVDRGAGWRLSTNGLPESLVLPPGSRRGRLATAFGLGNLGSAARPEARSLFMVGLGGGVALETIPAEIERLRVAEIEPAVVAANRRLAPLRARDPLADPRLEIVLADARALLRRDPSRWHLIVSQPSHPWTAAGAHLYSREFFSQVKDRLTADGVFVQWMGLAFLDASLLRSLTATLLATFREVELVQLDPGSVLFLASDVVLDLSRSAPLPGSAAHWSEIGIFGRDDLADARLLDTGGARRFAGEAAKLSEDRNPLRFATTAAGFRALEPAALVDLLAPYDAFASGTGDTARLRRLLERGFPARAAKLAQRSSGRGGDLAATVLAARLGEPSVDVNALRQGAAAGDREAMAAWLLRHRGEVEAGAELSVGGQGDQISRTIVAGWRARARGDRFALEDALPHLESIPASHPLGREATLLLAHALLQRHQPAARAAAARLLEQRLGPSALARELLLAADAAMAAGNFRAARGLLDEIAAAHRQGAPRELWRAYGRLPEALRPFEDFVAASTD